MLLLGIASRLEFHDVSLSFINETVNETFKNCLKQYVNRTFTKVSFMTFH
jgi:hypothetical protein